jgi:hypothetical protein
MPETQTTFPDPQAGGQYVRNADGSLTQIGKTDEAPIAPTPTEQPADAPPAAPRRSRNPTRSNPS